VITRVLITGITGFIGSHLAERLVADGVEVHGTRSNRADPHLAAIASKVTIHHRPRRCGRASRRDRRPRPDAVVHLAARRSRRWRSATRAARSR
jgi:GDP-4-dehydro-6-deoxy-D-mannose reductase